MYSTYEGKPVVTERLTKTLKNKIFKHMAAVSKSVYFDVLDDIIDNYNNTFRRIIGMKSIDVKCGSYAEYSVDSNEKDPKFKVRDHIRILKYKNIFAKGCNPNWSEEAFVIRKIKNTVPWTKWCRNYWNFLWERIAEGKSKRIQNRKDNWMKR